MANEERTHAIEEIRKPVDAALAAYPYARHILEEPQFRRWIGKWQPCCAMHSRF